MLASIGSKLVNKTGEGVFLDIVLGIVGAVVGGWLFSMFGAHGVTGVNVYSLIVAVIGAVCWYWSSITPCEADEHGRNPAAKLADLPPRVLDGYLVRSSDARNAVVFPVNVGRPIKWGAGGYRYSMTLTAVFASPFR